MPQCNRCHSFACDGRTVVCLGCNTEQCHGNGLGRGSCSVCIFGILPGWSGSSKPCGYKGCTDLAAFHYVRGTVKSVCLAHAVRPKIAVYAQGNPKASRVTLAEYVTQRLAERYSCRGVVVPGEQTIARAW